ncbi:YncE family protein [Spirosoma koreense]
MVSFIKKITIVTCLLGASQLHVSAQQTPTYSFIQKISLPTGDGKWDYLKMDGERERLFVSHLDRVHVIDLNTNKAIGEITGLQGVHGVTLAKALQKGYISNGTNNTVTVFDYNTFNVLKTIQLEGKKPDAMLFDKYSNRVLAFCNGDKVAIAIDAATDQVVGKVEVGEAPEFAVSTDKGMVYVNLEDANEIVAFDPKTLSVKQKFSLGANVQPTGLAIDAASNRLFSVCRKSKTLVVLDATSGKIIQTLPIGGGVDAVVYEKDLKLVMTSNGEGSVTIVHQDSPDKYSVVQTLTTKPGQKTMVHRGTTHRIYLSGADYQADGKTPAPGTFGVYVYGPSPKQ